MIALGRQVSIMIKLSKFWIIAIGAAVLLTETHPLSAEEVCRIEGAQDILDCALKHHPDVVNAQNEKLRDEKLVRVARQRPNLELDGRILGGENGGDAILSTETTLLHTLELGGKRRKRIDQAHVLMDQSALNLRENSETTALQTVLTLYRLRQITTELASVDEAITTFDKLLRALRNRPQLTPEQQVSKISFELAREEYRLKKTVLVQEQENLTHLLELATQVSYDRLEGFLPPFREEWPASPAGQSVEGSEGSVVAKVRAEQRLAEANLKIARSKAWPDLKIGPTLETESLAANRRTVGGVGIEMPIPVLNLNRGEKAFASADKVRADSNLELTLRTTAVERAIQLKRYEAATKVLKSSQGVRYLGMKHKDIESFFERGLVPSTLILETHRQLYEITRTRNEQELTAIDALWRLYIIDGTVFDARI